MKNTIVSLSDISKLSNNPSLSEAYVRYVSGLGNTLSYRHQEIMDIKALLDVLSMEQCDEDGFIYSYTVPQLNKEFDLLKISADTCVNIELKSSTVSQEKMTKQLIQNQHYLRLLNKSNLYLFTFISSTGNFYYLNNAKLEQVSIEFVRHCLVGMEYKILDLDNVFSPKNILVSPLNDTDRFLTSDYLLTENQADIKQEILSHIASTTEPMFYAITGGAGTGKTLLLYDISRTLANTKRVLLVHCGILCQGHLKLNRQLNNFRIVSAKNFGQEDVFDADIIVMDEAHRAYVSLVEKAKTLMQSAKGACIFSYDAKQKLSRAENNRKTVEIIEQLCTTHKYTLTNKIRTNKELARFISCLRNLSNLEDGDNFPNVKIIFEPNHDKAFSLALSMENAGYTFISYTPSSIYLSPLDSQKSEFNTHNVIGQEFNKVCMILNKYFYYDGNILKAKEHPNPDYLLDKLLYQGLTRVRNKIALIITEERLLEKIITLFK